MEIEWNNQEDLQTTWKTLELQRTSIEGTSLEIQGAADHEENHTNFKDSPQRHNSGRKINGKYSNWTPGKEFNGASPGWWKLAEQRSPLHVDRAIGGLGQVTATRPRHWPGGLADRTGMIRPAHGLKAVETKWKLIWKLIGNSSETQLETNCKLHWKLIETRLKTNWALIGN